MDKRCKTSINGLRVTDAIAQLLPDAVCGFEANIDVFRTVIRFLKHWAKRRCVYGNKEGLLMGVALEVMLVDTTPNIINAFVYEMTRPLQVLVCQLHPNYSAFDILHNFFKVCCQLQPPTTAPNPQTPNPQLQTPDSKPHTCNP
jgi:poly(A) polymerase